MCKFPSRLAAGAIRVYQKTVSPDHGIFKRLYPDGFCRYYPSCSEYAAQSIENNGIIVGVGLGAWRIARCNPWSRGGFDPAPKLRKSNLEKSEARISKHETNNKSKIRNV